MAKYFNLHASVQAFGNVIIQLPYDSLDELEEAVSNEEIKTHDNTFGSLEELYQEYASPRDCDEFDEINYCDASYSEKDQA